MARANAGTERRLRQAGFPFAATIEQFDFRFRPDLKRQVVLRYLDPTFVEQARSLALIGAPGLGKTMLAVCVATKHVQLGATARFVTAQTLAHHLGRLQTAMGRQRLLKPLLTCDVLVLDELGYLPTTAAFGPALYELIASRYERRPTILTSNKSLTVSSLSHEVKSPGVFGCVRVVVNRRARWDLLVVSDPCRAPWYGRQQVSRRRGPKVRPPQLGVGAPTPPGTRSGGVPRRRRRVSGAPGARGGRPAPAPTRRGSPGPAPPGGRRTGARARSRGGGRG